MNRRRFLQTTAALGFLPFGRYGWAARTPAPGRNRLIVVFLRGAVDGLSVVVPYSEPNYYRWRPRIAIPERGEGAVLDLDRRFGLHPALASLMPLWREGKLAFVHAAGSPHPTRSHFEAQDYMESGTPGVRSTPDGWMNRLLAALPGSRTPTSGVSFGSTLPRIFAGKVSVANVPVAKAATRPLPIDRPEEWAHFDRLYQDDDALSRAYRQGREARAQLLNDLEADMKDAAKDAPPALRFAGIAEQAGRLLARNTDIRLAFLALSGWDTHINQGGAEGRLADRLRALGEGLVRLGQALGKEFENTVIVVMSEFGRTVRENGNGGTDHGHGNVLWLIGGPVRGGKIHGAWPGLEEEDLYEGRDLAVTTDFRTVLDVVLARHFGLDTTQRSRVFPQFQGEPAAFAGLIA